MHHYASQYFIEGNDIKIADSQFSKFTLQQLPRLYFIEQLKEDDSKEKFVGILRAPINHILDEILTDTVRSSIRVGEFIRSQYRIFCPRRRGPMKSTEKY